MTDEVTTEKYFAKLAADELTTDECLAAVAGKRRWGFPGIMLRPGQLYTTYKLRVALGKTEVRFGRVSKNDVAPLAGHLSEKAKKSAWLDLSEGEEYVHDAVRRFVKQGVDSIEGEDVEAIMQKYG